MSSPVRKQAETDFDDLLGDLVNELAMAPPSQSAVSLIPEQPEAPTMRVESTQELAAQAAAAAATKTKSSGDTVKIIAIIAGSLTALGVAALLVLGGGSEEPEIEVADVAAATAAAEQAAMEAAMEASASQAKRDLDVALAGTRQSLEAAVAADADSVAKAQAEAQAAAQAAAKANKRTRPRRPRPKSPKPDPAPGNDFDDL